MVSMTDHSLPQDVPNQLFIDGRWVDGSRGTFAVENPATGEVLAEVADASVEDGISALDAAVAAQDSWARTPARTRAEILRAAFELARQRSDDLARVMTLEMGKPLAESQGEVTYGLEYLRWFSEEAARIDGNYRPSPEGNFRQLVTKRPVGPSLLITPWNFPLAMITRKVAPALAAGCTVVVRPAGLTPLTALLFLKTIEDAGVPAGVVNLITSRQHDVTDALLADPRLRKLSFTGSTPVGKALLKQAADGVLRTSMELGGNAPFLVFEDADLAAAAEGAQLAKLRNMGEACTAANRFIVHESVADEFGRLLADRFSGLSVGDGLEGHDIGALVNADARDGIHELVTEATSAGATVLTGGEPGDEPGWFYPPTVLTGVGRDARVVTEEIFGPVAPIVTFATEEEAFALANAASVGLAGYVYTRDLKRALRASELLQTGMIAINQGVLSNAAAPFGGIKQSGLGREGAHDGIEEYLETIYVCLPDPFAG